jgi:thiol-activated cytolysin
MLSPETQQLSAAIRGLKYDDRLLLASPPAGSVESLPARDRSSTGKGVVLCTNKKESLKRELSDMAILRPTAGVVFPGALVRANRHLTDGTPEAAMLPRAPVRITLELPGLGAEGTRDVQPVFSDVNIALQAMLDRWEERAASSGYTNSARSIQTISKAYSSEQLALDLGFAAKWSSGEVQAQLKVDGARERNVVVAYFRQIYYSVTVDTPAEPGAVFAPGVTPADLARAGLDEKNPPAFVASVDYGRIILVKMETSSSHLRTDAEGALQQATGGRQVSAELKAKYEKIARESTFTVIVIGGAAEGSARIQSVEDLNLLPKMINEGLVYSRRTPAAPISYTVRFLKDNAPAVIGFTTEYNQQECVLYESAAVKIRHSGAYVAKFSVTWDQPNAQGKPEPKSWESGNKTAGYTATIPLDGDATNIRVQGWAKTGLVWDPWGEIFNEVEAGPINRTYIAKGTTLGRKWSWENADGSTGEGR